MSRVSSADLTVPRDALKTLPPSHGMNNVSALPLQMNVGTTYEKPLHSDTAGSLAMNTAIAAMRFPNSRASR